MCELCRKIMNPKTDPCDEDIQIVKEEYGYDLFVRTGDSFMDFNIFGKPGIRYCPVCGRKLGVRME